MIGSVASLLYLPSWGSLIIALAAGLLVGIVHFASLRRNADLYVQQGKLWGAILVQLARLSLVVLILSAAAWAGAGPLLAAASGVLIARAAVLRRYRPARFN